MFSIYKMLFLACKKIPPQQSFWFTPKLPHPHPYRYLENPAMNNYGPVYPYVVMEVTKATGFRFNDNYHKYNITASICTN